MHSPLDKTVIRTALNESDSTEKDRLNPALSPAGGAYGQVRSSGTKFHAGWDMYAPIYAPVYAISNGIVTGVSSRLGPEEYVKDSYGNHVCLQLDPAVAKAYGADKLFAFYGHLSSVNLSAGAGTTIRLIGLQHVNEGDVIGWVGRSGNAAHSPSHLHFEIRLVAYPPLKSGSRYRMDPGVLLGFEAYSCRPCDEHFL